MLRRGYRRLIIKLLFVAAIIWIASLLIIGRTPSDDTDLSRKAVPNANLGNNNDRTALKMPVLERPDFDRLRFQDAMRQGAEAERLRKESRNQERLIQEELARRRAEARRVPPFMMASSNTSLGNKQSNNLLGFLFRGATGGDGGEKGKSAEQADPKLAGLIASGLIVPKWNIDTETPTRANAPGENGQEINIQKEKLSVVERQKFDEGFVSNAFNQYASDMISMHRSLPDVRDPECKSLKYRENLPDTSVIIIFHNEAWSALLRTVHSVLDRSPPHLVKEILLVDDFSDLPHLKQPLEDYIAKLLKVRVIRSKSRQGLIRARLLGASLATGEVLTFLDSHCECTLGWLEPLLHRIAENKSNVVTPIIDVIDDNTLRYQYSSARSTSVGGFDWNLQFNWHAIPEREMQRRKSIVDPVQSPTMAGGLFSISRDYFEHLGTYDPGMDIWGGENLELSFRVWMCGGTLEIILCSHVGHIFRSRSPYAWRTGVNVVRKNSVRLAEVWMDQHKQNYYERFGNDLVWMCGGTLEIVVCSHVGHIFRSRSPYKWRSGENVLKKNTVRLAEVWMDDFKSYYFERFNNDLGEYGDVSARKELRKRLNCKSFDWYLKNIYPEQFVPGESLASGEIRCKALGTFNGARQPICLDSAVDKNALNKPVNLWPCHNTGGNQYWMLSKIGEIRRDDACMDYTGSGSVMMFACHGAKGNQEWLYRQDDSLYHVNSGSCMELSEDGLKILMMPCKTGVDRQVWLWRRKSQGSSSLATPLSSLVAFNNNGAFR